MEEQIETQEKKKKISVLDVIIIIVVVSVISPLIIMPILLSRTHTVQNSIKGYTSVFAKEDDDVDKFSIGKKHYELHNDAYVVWVDDGHGYKLQEFDDDDATFKFDVDDAKDAYIEREESKLGTVMVEFHIPENSKLVKTKD